MTFRFSGPLLRFVSYEREVSIPAVDLRGAISGLLERHQALRPVLLTGEGEVRATHRLFLNGEPLTAPANPPVREGDIVDLITAIAGGF